MWSLTGTKRCSGALARCHRSVTKRSFLRFYYSFHCPPAGARGEKPLGGKTYGNDTFFHSLFHTSSREVLEVQATTC